MTVTADRRGTLSFQRQLCSVLLQVFKSQLPPPDDLHPVCPTQERLDVVPIRLPCRVHYGEGRNPPLENVSDEEFFSMETDITFEDRLRFGNRGGHVFGVEPQPASPL